LLRLIVTYPQKFSASGEWLTEVILPFCKMIQTRDALIVSLAAGIGEELFFRAALQQEIGLVGSSLIFALIHFGRAPHRYPVYLRAIV
jgi:membrane protease YdiL (CAAX protease family)